MSSEYIQRPGSNPPPQPGDKPLPPSNPPRPPSASAECAAPGSVRLVDAVFLLDAQPGFLLPEEQLEVCAVLQRALERHRRSALLVEAG